MTEVRNFDPQKEHAALNEVAGDDPETARELAKELSDREDALVAEYLGPTNARILDDQRKIERDLKSRKNIEGTLAEHSGGWQQKEQQD